MRFVCRIMKCQYDICDVCALCRMARGSGRAPCNECMLQLTTSRLVFLSEFHTNEATFNDINLSFYKKIIMCLSFSTFDVNLITAVVTFWPEVISRQANFWAYYLLPYRAGCLQSQRLHLDAFLINRTAALCYVESSFNEKYRLPNDIILPGFKNPLADPAVSINHLFENTGSNNNMK